MNVLTKKDKKYIVKIEGKEYELAPVNWNVLSGIEEELKCSITELMPILQKSIYSTTLTLAWIFLRDKYELNMDTIGAVTDHKEIMLITTTISDALIDFFGVE
jgi:hypothetical protein